VFSDVVRGDLRFPRTGDFNFNFKGLTARVLISRSALKLNMQIQLIISYIRTNYGQ
jgi:hypothetical protein